jgi:hypothetical protein
VRWRLGADDDFFAAVVRKLPQARVSLDQALKTSEREGSPISAEYDVEDGDLQISVYTKQDEQFSEIIIDPKSGSIKSAKPLSNPKEINEAQAQSAALSKAKLPLMAALGAAVGPYGLEARASAIDHGDCGAQVMAWMGKYLGSDRIDSRSDR